MTPTTPCERCGHPIELGEYPFCPHGFGASNVRQDAFIGGLTLENLGPHPVTVYSRTELRRELQARGLEECVRHVPIPGTDKSPHTTSWVAVDLEAGRVLAERQATTRVRGGDDEPRDPAVSALVRQTLQELGHG